MSDRFDSSSCRAKVWIGRVKSNCPPEFLENTFKKAGKLLRVETGFPGFAFADFDNEEDADEACKMLNKTFIEGVGEVIVSRATQRGYGDACVKRDLWQRGKGGSRPIGYHAGRSRSRSRRSRSFSRRRSCSRSRSSSIRRQRARYSRSPSSFTRTRYRNRSQSIERKFRPRTRSRSRSRSRMSPSRSIERKFRPKHPSHSPEARNAREPLDLPVVISEPPRQDHSEEIPPYEPPPIASKERSPPREQSREPPRERSREQDRSPEPPREQSREVPQERSRETPRDQSREAPRDRSREAPRDRSRDAAPDRSRDSAPDRSRDAAPDRSRDTFRDRSPEPARHDQSREISRDIRDKRKGKTASNEGIAAVENASQPGNEMVLKDRSSGTSSAIRATPRSGGGGQLSVRERAALVQFFDCANARDILLENAAVLGVPDLFVPEILNGFPHSFQGLSQEGVVNLLSVLGNFVSHRASDVFSSSPECSVEVRQSLGINAAGERVIRKTIIVDGSISCSEERIL